MTNSQKITTQTVSSGNSVNGREVVLQVEHLSVHYATPTGAVIAANDITFDVYRRELIGLIGESGCGKTTTAMAILRLVQPPGRIVDGKIIINGKDLVPLNDKQLRQVRWRELASGPSGGDELPEPAYEDQRPDRRRHRNP